MKIRQAFQLFTFAIGLIYFVSSCSKDDNKTTSETGKASEFNASVPLEWNKIFLDIERYAAGYRPGPAPRSLGLMGLACYEACVTGMPDYNSLETRYPGINIPNVASGQTYHWPTVVHSIYTTMIPKFFPDIRSDVRIRVEALINTFNAKFSSEVEKGIYEASKTYGQEVGLAVWNWSTTDPVGHDHYKDPFGTYDWASHYRGAGDWKPTVPGPTKPMGSVYGKARTFAITETEKICLPPSAYYMQYSENPNSEYYSQALQVYTKSAATSYNTKWVGEFWSDDLLNLTFSPGPRWIAIANQIIEAEKSDLETALVAYAKTGMALSDAAVGAWHSKYLYNVERPVTYILKVIDPNYKVNLNNPLTGDVGFTPPFPAYPSGHSTMGAAGAEALASVFGYAYAMTDKCHENRTDFEGKPRSFGSLYEMAQENAWSRVLLGVHWRMDCDEGVNFGTKIGRAVNKLPWKK
ncbi:MAG: vanadium-dependent haloperoxidase [Saprospiraceae bacterium]